MTRDELAAIGLATYGMEWRHKLARALDMSPRTMLRLASGKMPISDNIAADIRRLIGGGAIADPDWPRDEWIIGDAPVEADTNARREYVVHTKRPRFIARIVAVDDDGTPTVGEEPADVGTGVTYASSDYVVSEIAWIDPAPQEPGAIHRLMEAACDAVDGSD